MKKIKENLIMVKIRKELNKISNYDELIMLSKCFEEASKLTKMKAAKQVLKQKKGNI